MSRKSSLLYRCEKCDHEVELKLTVVSERKARSRVDNDTIKHLNTQPDTRLSLPVCVKLSYSGFWVTNTHGFHISVNDESCTRNSVMLNNDCLLYVYKLALRHYLLSQKIITPHDIDAQNLVPHVVVRKSPSDTQSKYKSANGEIFIIDEIALSVKNDFLLIELDVQRDLHMTLIFSKKIKNKCNLVNALRTVIGNLNEHPELIEKYSSLEYFGLAEIDYWYNTPESYPLDVNKPLDYQPLVITKIMPLVSAAGSIL